MRKIRREYWAELGLSLIKLGKQPVRPNKVESIENCPTFEADNNTVNQTMIKPNKNSGSRICSYTNIFQYIFMCLQINFWNRTELESSLLPERKILR